MSFDSKAFEKTQFTHRIGEVEVPELAAFFGKDEKPIWKVRNLTAPELYKAEMATQQTERLRGIIEGVTSDKPADIAESVKQLMGAGKDLEPEFRKRLAMVEMASIEPEISKQIAVKLANVSPNAFYRIVAKINDVSGKGSEMGKPKASTKTTK